MNCKHIEVDKKYQIEKKKKKKSHVSHYGTVPSSCFCHGASQYCCLLNAHG